MRFVKGFFENIGERIGLLKKDPQRVWIRNFVYEAWILQQNLGYVKPQ
jgi:hypothetical protein